MARPRKDPQVGAPGQDPIARVAKPNTYRWPKPRKQRLADRVRVQEQSRGSLGPVTGPQDIKKKR